MARHVHLEPLGQRGRPGADQLRPSANAANDPRSCDNSPGGLLCTEVAVDLTSDGVISPGERVDGGDDEGK